MTAPSKFTGYLTVVEPVSHHAERPGNFVSGSPPRQRNEWAFRRVNYLYQGRVVPVPVISANSFRGVWRRLAARELCEIVGIDPAGLGRATYMVLFMGGALARKDRPPRFREGDSPEGPEPVLNTGGSEAVLSAIPLISVFGGVIDRPIQGKLWVSFAVPITVETAHYLGEPVPEVSASNLTEWTFGTRVDDYGLEHFHTGEGGPGEPEEKQGLPGHSAPRGALQGEGRGPVGTAQMIVRWEYLIPGTRLKHSFGFRVPPSHLERSLVASVFEHWTAHPSVGGKINSGHGRVVPEYDLGGLGTPDLYREYLHQNRQRIRDYILSWERGRRWTKRGAGG